MKVSFSLPWKTKTGSNTVSVVWSCVYLLDTASYRDLQLRWFGDTRFLLCFGGSLSGLSEERQTCKWIALGFLSDLCIFFYLFHFCIENITFLFPYRVVYQEPVYGNKLLQVWNPDWWKNSSLWLWVCCKILLTRLCWGGRHFLTERGKT